MSEDTSISIRRSMKRIKINKIIRVLIAAGNDRYSDNTLDGILKMIEGVDVANNYEEFDE